MNMKIKIKNLILILALTVLVFIWGVPFVTLQIANVLADRNNEKADFFYNRYYNYPFIKDSIKARYIYADSLIDGFLKFQITFSGWGGGSDTDPLKLEESKKILADILKERNLSKSDLGYVEEAYKMLLDIAISTNNVNMLEKWLDFKNPEETQKMEYTRDMYRAFLFHVNRDEEMALEIAEKYKNSEYKDGLLDVLLAEIYFFKGDYEKTKEFLGKADNINYWDRMEPIFASGRYLDRKYYLENEKDILGDANKIRGTVFFEDKPLPFVEIYVQDPHGGLRTGGGNYLGITDENGYFETVGLRTGTVQIVLGLDGVVLTDKVLKKTNVDYIELGGEDVNVDFVFKETLNILSPGPASVIKDNIFDVSWEAVEGADYYNVEPVIFSEPYNMSGSSFRSPIEDINGDIKIKDIKASFNIEKLKNNLGGLSFSGEEMLLEPSSVLGVFLPEVEYPIVVNAFDKNGNIITSSLALRSYYDNISSIKREGDLSQGEKLILSTDYPKAISYYEEKLQEDPKNAEALLYLTKIYAIGWKDGKKDYTKAIDYANRYDKAVSKEIMVYRAISYMDYKDIKANKELVKEVVYNTKKRDDEYYQILGQLNIAFEEFKDARDAFEMIEEYVPNDLLNLNIYLGDYQKAIENVESDKFYPSILSTSKTTDAIYDLEIKGISEKDKKVFDEFLLKLISREIYDQKNEAYKSLMSKLKNKSAIIIVDQIYKDYGWLDRY
ncbi:MAG: hypothetical protein RBR71_12415 [Gudongella sp.]|nr:hypothetical protein [Gudongella sp.]